MDVNGVRFHLVQGEADWEERLEQAAAGGLVYDTTSRSLALGPIVERFRTTAAETLLTIADRRGADCDRYGNWHWIDDDSRSIRILPCTASRSEVFWSADDLTRRPCPPSPDEGSLFQPVAETPPAYPDLVLSGLAITERHYLVVGTRNPGGLLTFDLHGSGPPVFTVWPEEVAFQPFDMATAFGGGVWILDGGGPADLPRYWRLDSYLRPIRAARLVELALEAEDQFAPVGGEARLIPAQTFPAGWPLGLASPVAAEAPRAIVGLPDDSVLILDSPASAPFSRVLRFRGEEMAGDIAFDPTLLRDHLEEPAAVLGHDMAFVPEPSPLPGVVRGRLYVVGVDGNQAFGFDLEADGTRFELSFRPEQLPLRRFGGKALECCAGRVWYDLGDRWVPLVVHPRRRYFESAVIDGLVFDGDLPDTHWRRLLLDACIPSGARVGVESRTANERRELRQTLWRTEPGLYLRADGAEIPYHTPFSDRERDLPDSGTWETVFQSARGRFLELRLTLFGGGRLTPRVRAMRIYSPAFSYLERYLPAVYREEPVSASFLDRYLANVEGLFTALEGRIAAAEGLLDSRITPDEYLDWLAGWLGATLDPDWDSARRRLFLDHAELLFRWRGTPAGLHALIRLAIEPCPSEEIFADLIAGRTPREERYAGSSVRLVETFLTRSFGGVSLGDPTRPVQPGLAAGSWEPRQGAEPLHERFREFLVAKYAPGEPANAPAALADAWEPGAPPASMAEVRLPPVRPAHPVKAADWLDFLGSGLGFNYAAIGAGDTAFFRQFLERRWGRIDALNAAWQLSSSSAWASFGAVQLPDEDDFPPAGQRLHDWIAFASLAVPIRDSAHRFTVLIPSLPGETEAERARRLEVVRAIVAREKPAHTDFDIKPFWALFQVGMARVGLDTALGEGARFTAIELGRAALGEGFLDHGHPWNVKDRAVIGRNAVAEIRT